MHAAKIIRAVAILNLATCNPIMGTGFKIFLGGWCFLITLYRNAADPPLLSHFPKAHIHYLSLTIATCLAHTENKEPWLLHYLHQNITPILSLKSQVAQPKFDNYSKPANIATNLFHFMLRQKFIPDLVCFSYNHHNLYYDCCSCHCHFHCQWILMNSYADLRRFRTSKFGRWYPLLGSLGGGIWQSNFYRNTIKNCLVN